MATAELYYHVASLPVVGTDFAPVEYVDGTNLDHHVRAFDGDANEYAGPSTFQVPQDIGTGNVTFVATGRRDSGTGAANIILRFQHLARADSEAEDTAYTNEDSSGLAVDTTAGDLDILTWTETVANLGWNAGETVWFRIGRLGADASDTLNSVDWLWSNFSIRIPLA